MSGLAVCHYGIIYADKMNVNGLISVAPAYKLTPKTNFIQSVLSVFSPVVGRLSPTFEVDFALDQNDMKHDEQLRELSRKDPLIVKKICAGTPINAEHCQEFDNHNAGKFKAPLLMLVAMSDCLVDPKASISVFVKFASTDKEISKLEGYFHEVWSESKEMREKAYDIMISWIDKRMPKKE